MSGQYMRCQLDQSLGLAPHAMESFAAQVRQNCQCNTCQQYRSLNQGQAQALPSQWNDYQRQIMSDARRSAIPNVAQMTAADLGIIDQNLDDKIGMEP